MKSFSYTKSIPSLVILLQHSLQVRSLVEYLTCKLRVGNNLLVAIVLQGAGADIQPLAHLLTREEKFSCKEWLVSDLRKQQHARIAIMLQGALSDVQQPAYISVHRLGRKHIRVSRWIWKRTFGETMLKAEVEASLTFICVWKAVRSRKPSAVWSRTLPVIQRTATVLQIEEYPSVQIKECM